ncbi:ficolin-3 isoform X3 [Myotis daubentonii]|uniref:ficolin-3 isoform X3 n=1 Tax=Myotis daubentonii TaxID=98922 RepID=UPI0028735CBA|nr:ficolin-3 isoform X3 [Myotis daubentonii]
MQRVQSLESSWRTQGTGSQQNCPPAQLSWSPRESWGERSSRPSSYRQWREQLGLDFWLQIPVAPALSVEWDLQHLCLWISGQPGPPGQMGPKGEPGECIQRTCSGARRVFQRRQDGSVDFFRSWSSYKAGFGSQESEFWLGNENLHQLTLQGTWELRVELEDFDGNRTFAHYGPFRLLGESDHYQLVLGKFLEGTAGDSLSFHNGKRFSTYDADHDTTEGNCAVTVHGAWWYEACYHSNLNGPYATSPTTAHKYGIDWASGLGVGHPYRRVRLMLR